MVIWSSSFTGSHIDTLKASVFASAMRSTPSVSAVSALLPIIGLVPHAEKTKSTISNILVKDSILLFNIINPPMAALNQHNIFGSLNSIYLTYINKEEKPPCF